MKRFALFVRSGGAEGSGRKLSRPACAAIVDRQPSLPIRKARIKDEQLWGCRQCVSEKLEPQQHVDARHERTDQVHDPQKILTLGWKMSDSDSAAHH